MGCLTDQNETIITRVEEHNVQVYTNLLLNLVDFGRLGCPRLVPLPNDHCLIGSEGCQDLIFRTVPETERNVL